MSERKIYMASITNDLSFSGEWNEACGRLQGWLRRIRYGKQQQEAAYDRHRKQDQGFKEWLVARKGMTEQEAEEYIFEMDEAIHAWERGYREPGEYKRNWQEGIIDFSDMEKSSSQGRTFR